MTEAPGGPRRLWLGFILVVGAGLRFTSLFSLPIFNDEAIYAVWARSILAGDWLISFSDGKQPLYYWLAALVSGLVDDPLAGLRVTSALAGLAGIAGAYLAGSAVADRRAGLAAAWIYAIVPYMVVNDRLGLGDGLVAALGLYVFWAAVKLGRAPGRAPAAILGGALGLALLVKTTAVLLVPAAVLGMIIGRAKTGSLPAGEGGTAGPRDGMGELINRGLAALFLASIPTAALVIFARHGAFVVGKSSSFLLTLAELQAIPYQRWLTNVGSLTRWLINYLQWPGLALIGVALVVRGSRLKAGIYIVLIAAAVPLFITALAARIWFSRYAVSSVPFIILAMALVYAAIVEVLPAGRWKMSIPLLAAALFSVTALSQDALLIRSPVRFAWTADDRWQYIEGWPSGYGFGAAADYLRLRSAAAGPAGLKVFVDRNIGFPRDGLRLAMIDKKAELIAVDGRVHLPKVPLDERGYLYIAADPRIEQPEFARRHRRWPLVATFSKPGNKSAWNIYEWRPDQKQRKSFRR